MNIRRRASLFVVFALIAAVAAGVALLLPRHQPPTPSLTFALLDGRTATLGDWRGRPLLIAFWATSCAPCVEELPDLVRLYRDLHPYGLELVAVAMPYDPPLAVQTFARQNEIPYPIAFDVTGDVLRAFDDINVIPTAVLLDPAGGVLLRHVGKLDTDRVRKLVAPFLTSLPHNQITPAT